MTRVLLVLGLLLFFAYCFGEKRFFGGMARAAEPSLTMFAAASTTNALTEIVGLYERAGKGNVVLSFGSSSTLAKQIESGAPVDLFLSASGEWMDYLAKRDLLVQGSRADLLGNRIVLIVPTVSSVKSIDVIHSLDLTALLGKGGRLAVGDPAHVPVGVYAKAALQSMRLWDQVEHRLAPAKDVRSGLVMVERGEAPLGIVYASDVVITDKVRVVCVFPEASHPKADYPVAVLHGGKVEAARKFITFLRTNEAVAVWLRNGFTVHQ